MMMRVRCGLLCVVVCVLVVGVGVSGASAASVGWAVHGVAEPSSFSSTDAVECGTEEKCDRYALLVENVSDEVSRGEVTLTDTLPAGIAATRVVVGGAKETDWNCEGIGQSTVTCHLAGVEGPKGEPLEGVILPGHYANSVTIYVSEPLQRTGVLHNEVVVEGGGLASSTAREQTPIGQVASFAVSEFAVEPGSLGGVSTLQAGSHPWELTSTVAVPSAEAPRNGNKLGAPHAFAPVHDIRDVAVELPAGFLGDPLATARCTEVELRTSECPKESRVGTFGVIESTVRHGEYTYTEDTNAEGGFTPLYNMVPSAGYPAEFGLALGTESATVLHGGVPVIMYANLVHTGTGYRVRVTAPFVPEDPEPTAVVLTFFGEPGQFNGSGSQAAFLSSPSDCYAEEEGLSGSQYDPAPSGAPLTAKDSASRIEVASWAEPDRMFSDEVSTFPSLTGCGALLFDPSFSLAPSPSGAGPEQEGSTQADEPSAYSVDLKVPQTSEFSEPATPDLRDTTVTLPEGLSVSPSAATGLVACQEEGPEGINVGSNDIGARGEDLGDPEATELGEGHAGPGGNSSPYDDGFYHTAPGHCPKASSLGSVEVCTPLLPNRVNSEGKKEEGEQYCEEHPGVAPLTGNVYLGEPECGGSGQPECNDAYAEGKGGPDKDGKLFKMYIEVQGSGVIAKLPGTVTANPLTGQLTSTFKESPQVEFGELKLHFKGGPRASIANPQTCGTFTTSTVLEPWSHNREAAGPQGTPNAEPSSSFAIGGCAATMAFNPSFTAGTTNPQAGAFSPFVLSFGREDREQNLSGLTVTMPPGLVGKIAGIALCGEAQANAGTCSQESEIGTTSALAGPGTEPFAVTGGHVYLTGPYGGGPFGLSIVVPTKAGPFNLGNEVIRAAIHINPNTAQVTSTTNPLPQSKDGVPFRLRRVNTEINRPGFILNPTNCAPQSITATISAAQGATANVSSAFTATGCQSLAFKPKFSVSTKAKTSKADGASLVVDVSQVPGEANIGKVDLTIPKILPSRLTTIQKACLAATFDANPASCPEGSDIGTGTAHTPLLNGPLTGPAYLVSHGGAEFPDVEFVLQGEGVTIVLDGKTDIKHGITYSRFETVPDSPISSFETVLPEGPHSALTTEKPGETNLCATATTKLVTVKKKVTKRVHGKLKKVTVTSKKTVAVAQSITIPTTITAQNGAVINQNTPVVVTGCTVTKPRIQAPAAKKNKRKTGKK